jgi:hypothetical protein
VVEPFKPKIVGGLRRTIWSQCATILGDNQHQVASSHNLSKTHYHSVFVWLSNILDRYLEQSIDLKAFNSIAAIRYRQQQYERGWQIAAISGHGEHTAAVVRKPILLQARALSAVDYRGSGCAQQASSPGRDCDEATTEGRSD